MNSSKPALRYWLFGLAIFAVLVALGLWLQAASGYGIVDHQLAGDAETVDAIQADWRANGVRGLALVSMAGDLLFIGIYSFGAWVAGRSFAASQVPLLRAIGGLVALAAVLFCFTDYTETVLQFIQLVAEEGNDGMAATAAAMQTPKTASWVVTFLGILGALTIRRFQSTGA